MSKQALLQAQEWYEMSSNCLLGRVMVQYQATSLNIKKGILSYKGSSKLCTYLIYK